MTGSRTMSTDSTPKLRIGLLIDSTDVPLWVARMLERIRSGTCAEVALLVVDESRPAPVATRLQRLRANPLATIREMVSWRLIKLRRRLLERPPRLPDAFALTDILQVVGDVPICKAMPVRSRWSDRFSEETLAQIRSHDLDVLVRIGFRILRGDILSAARYGVWSYHHGDNQINRGGPPGFWEVVERWPETGCTLQVLTEDMDNGLVLARTWSTTIYDCHADNNRNNYWKSLSLLPRQLECLHRKGADRYFSDIRDSYDHPSLYSRRLYSAPTIKELVRLLAVGLLDKLWRDIRSSFTVVQWILLFQFSSGMSMSFWRFKRIVPPKDRVWADPFAVERDGRHFVFFEECLWAMGKGHISAMELRPDGSHGEPRRVLVTDHHLSYPYILEHDGETYMIPEARSDHCIPLYRCVEFPDRWERCANLMDAVHAVDSSVHFVDGRWWMFTTIVENEGAPSCDELFLFHSETFPSTRWIPHPMNPVVSDVRRARSAGRLFAVDGRLYRPSQDCGDHYGRGIRINLIERLDTEEYLERTVSEAGPDWAEDLSATHTFTAAGDLKVIDAQLRRWRFGGRAFR